MDTRRVLAAEASARMPLHRLNARLDQEAQSASDRRIVTVMQEEPLA